MYKNIYVHVPMEFIHIFIQLIKVRIIIVLKLFV